MLVSSGGTPWADLDDELRFLPLPLQERPSPLPTLPTERRCRVVHCASASSVDLCSKPVLPSENRYLVEISYIVCSELRVSPPALPSESRAQVRFTGVTDRPLLLEDAHIAPPGLSTRAMVAQPLLLWAGVLRNDGFVASVADATLYSALGDMWKTCYGGLKDGRELHVRAELLGRGIPVSVGYLRRSLRQGRARNG